MIKAIVDDIHAITIRSCAPNTINQLASALRQSESLIYSMRIMLSKSSSPTTEHTPSVETISILEQRCTHLETELAHISNMYMVLFKQSKEKSSENATKPHQRTLSTQTVKALKSNAATDPIPPTCSMVGVQTEHVVVATPTQSMSQSKTDRDRIQEVANAKREVSALESKYV